MQGIKKDIDLANRIKAIHSHTDPPKAVQALADAATILWDVTLGLSASVTVTAARALDTPSGVENGDFGTLIITQGGVGAYQLTLPGTFKVVNGLAGVPPVGGAAGTTDILSWMYDGTNFWCTVGVNFT